MLSFEWLSFAILVLQRNDDLFQPQRDQNYFCFSFAARIPHFWKCSQVCSETINFFYLQRDLKYFCSWSATKTPTWLQMFIGLQLNNWLFITIQLRIWRSFGFTFSQVLHSWTLKSIRGKTKINYLANQQSFGLTFALAFCVSTQKNSRRTSNNVHLRSRPSFGIMFSTVWAKSGHTLRHT